MATIDIIVNSTQAVRELDQIEKKLAAQEAALEELSVTYGKNSTEYINSSGRIKQEIARLQSKQAELNKSVENFGVNAKQAFSNLNVGGFVRGLDKSYIHLKKLRKEAQLLSASFTDKLKTDSGFSEYNNMVNAGASVEEVSKVNSLMKQQMTIRGETQAVMRGSLGLMEKQVAAEKALLVIEKQRAGLTKTDLMGNQTMQVAGSSLSDTQKINALVDLGLASRIKSVETQSALNKKTKDVSFSQKVLKDMVDATAISYFKTEAGILAISNAKKAELVSAYKINQQKKIEDAIDKDILSSEQKIIALKAQRKSLQNGITIASEKEIAVQKALLAIEQQRVGVGTIQAGMNERSAQAALINDTKDLSQAQKIQAMEQLGLIDRTDKFTKATNSASKAQKNLYGAVRGVAGGLGQLWMAYGNVLPLLAGFAAAATLKSAFSESMDFEYTSTFASILSTESENAKGNIQNLNDVLEKSKMSLLELKGLASTPTELADGFLELVKAGQNVDEAMQSVSTSSKFATVAGVEMKDATKALVTQLSAWGDQLTQFDTTGEKIGYIGDVIAKAANESVIDLNDMMVSMSYVTELATTTGASFEELAGSVAILGQKGLFGSKSGQSLRTSITRLQVPTEKAKKIFDELGYSFSAFNADGTKRGLIDIFTELKSFTDTLSDEDMAVLSKEVFGLRSAKAGVNLISAMTGELQGFIERLKGAQGYLDSVYEKLSDTSKIKLEVLKADFIRELIKSVDSDQFKSFLDSLSVFVNKDFGSSVKGVMSLLQSVGSFSGAVLEMYSAIPGDLMDHGLIYYLVFGSNPIGQVIAGLIEANKLMDQINTTASKSKSTNKYFDFQGLPSFSNMKKQYSEATDAVWNFATFTNTAVDSVDGKEVNIKVNVDASDVEKLKQLEKHAANQSDSTLLKQAEKKYLESERKKANERLKLAQSSSKGAIKSIAELENSYADFGKTAALQWEQIKDLSSESIEDQLKGIDAIRFAYSKTSVPMGYEKDYDTVGGTVYSKDYTKTIGSTGAAKGSTDYKYVYENMKTAADKFYEGLSSKADNSYQSQINAAKNYSNVLDGMLNNFSGTFSDEYSKLGKTLMESLSAGDSDEMLKKMQSSFDSMGISGVEAFQKISDKAGTVLDTIRDKQKTLVSQIKGYAEDISGAVKTASDMRFDLAQGTRNPVEQYESTLDRINYKFAQSDRAMNTALSLTGSAREEMYKRANSLAQDALNLSKNLTSSEENKVSKVKAYQDALKVINKYESTITKNASKMDDSARKELKSWNEVSKDLEKVKEKADSFLNLFTESRKLDINTDSAKKKLQELIDMGEKVSSSAIASKDTSSTDALPQVVSGINKMTEGMNEFGSTSDTVFKRVYEDGSSAFIKIEKQVDSLIDKLNQAASAFSGMSGVQVQLPTGHRVGGPIPGWGGGDIVPSLLEPGEFVIRKESVRNYGKEFFENINAMKFQTGGYVGSKSSSSSSSDTTVIEIHDHSSGEVIQVAADRDNADKMQRYLSKSKRFRS